MIPRNISKFCISVFFNFLLFRFLFFSLLWENIFQCWFSTCWTNWCRCELFVLLVFLVSTLLFFLLQFKWITYSYSSSLPLQLMSCCYIICWGVLNSWDLTVIQLTILPMWYLHLCSYLIFNNVLYIACFSCIFTSLSPYNTVFQCFTKYSKFGLFLKLFRFCCVCFINSWFLFNSNISVNLQFQFLNS